MVLQTAFNLRRAALKAQLASSHALSTASGSSGAFLTLETRPNGVAIVRLDDKSAKVNTISTKMTKEMSSMLDTVENDPDIKSVVLISAKPGVFIAGADIAELNACKTEEEMRALSGSGQAFMNRLAGSKKPFVAAIEGSCMGGGLEVALACHYRVASQSKKTQLALPEVMLGLLPGAGGTQRLPKLVGIQAALDMMLTGRNIKPDKALKMGLVNQVADPYALESAAISAAEQLAFGNLKSSKKSRGFVNRILEDTPLRQIVFKKAEEMVVKKTGGHYPAPKLIIEATQTGIEQGTQKGLEVEAASFAKLGMTSEAKALMSIFFGQTALKKNRYGKPAKPVETMGIVGAGLMGAGIAQVSATKNVRVLLKDRNAVAAAKGEDYVRNNLDQKVKRKRMTIFDRDAVMAKIVPLSDEDDIWIKHIMKADLAIEAVFEDLALKHKVLSDLEKYVPNDCVLATNTSALPIADIASACKRPENVIGMHYFSPVPSMPLLEIIRHAGTSDATASKALDLGLRQGKTAIVVKDVPGFYVNRCLGPYIAETLALVADGVDPETLDKLITKWGLPVGPITLADEVGLDVAYHVNQTLSKALGVRMNGGDAKLFEEMIAKGFLGKKSGKGFFVQPSNGKKAKKILNADATNIVKKFQKEDRKLSEEDTVNRLISRFVNEAVLCVQDEIIESPLEGDIGAVFGIGFPPFIGGPFRYVDKVGSAKFTEMMQRYADQYGPQFAPAPLLQDMAKTNKKFHSA
ncbi:fatty acid oxidation alpha mitochondrial [Plasmopara halstedii]|uniref:Trifunctional enzyme subunit alpha, mitochondrial n=1 Tax=Plasmopara halstedii TaxID=4781 RepID=A0A0N7L433_PLAHL|nr:fatty acid oxidation alpha mitochondrial [Plasmopara halstedii]CEG37555.1 fatty acid oxidation alpha mitochondrial [Plasmopara halstedii]|eukprot:XP_024573924.1 fatty acid oxidation alpha mitochondrial [Plasmopara halstedii]